MTDPVSRTDRRTCRFPGCDRPAVPSDAGAGRPPEYCEDPGHNRGAAWRARRRLDADVTVRTVDDDDRPVDAARQRASAISGQVVGMVEHLGQQLSSLVEELRTVSDPDAAEAQIESVTADAAERVAAATARASRAEQAQRRAEAERADADVAAVEASDFAETLRVSLEEAHVQLDERTEALGQSAADLAQARADAAAAHQLAQADLAQLREELAAAQGRAEKAEHDRDRATARADEAATSRAEVEERARNAVTRAEAESVRAQQAEAETADIREHLDKARDQIGVLRGSLATATAERDAARADVAREKAHGDQRVSDLRSTHEQQITQLREDLTQARAEARDQRSRADRAEAPTQPAEKPTRSPARRGRVGDRQSDGP